MNLVLEFYYEIFNCYIISVVTIHYLDNRPWDYAFYSGAIAMFFSVIIVIIIPELLKKKDKKSS